MTLMEALFSVQLRLRPIMIVLGRESPHTVFGL